MIELMDEPAELLDLVNDKDQPIGLIRRQEILSLEQTKRGFARAVGIFLINSQGELWIPTRGAHKAIAPGGLDFSASEHVALAESYSQAALRGMREELNIEAKPELLQNRGVVSPFLGMPYFHTIYTYPYSATPTYNQEDFSDSQWLSPQVILNMLQAATPAKEILLPGLLLVINHGEE